MASATDATSTSRKPCSKGSPAGWAISQNTATTAVSPAIQNNRFISASFPAKAGAELLRRDRHYVEIVGDLPLRFFARLNLHFDVSLRANRGAGRPEIDLGEGMVAG